MLGKIIPVASGKGGVGKTFFSVNFGLELQSRGYKVCIFDIDINFSNVFILLNTNPYQKFEEYIKGEASILEAVIHTEYNIDIISAGVNILNFFKTNSKKKLKKLYTDLQLLRENYDFIILDCAAGMSDEQAKFLKESDDIILICNPEPTSLTDLYRVIKFIASYEIKNNMYLVVNKVKNIDRAVNLFREIQKVTSKFKLPISLSLLGPILANEDEVTNSIHKRIPHQILYPKTPIKGGLALAAQRLLYYLNIDKNEKSKNQSMIDLF